MRSIYRFLRSEPGYSRLFTLAAILCILLTDGCKKFITVAPPDNKTTQGTIYNNDATATSVLTGIYTNMSANYFSGEGLNSVAFFTGLSSDELSLYNPTSSAPANLIAYYINQLSGSPNTGYGTAFWVNIYSVIYVTNAAIEGLTDAQGLTPAVKQQLMGEARFMRAFCYFYIVNLYGDAPLATGTDYKVNRLLPRAAKDTVWQQIISDLQNAQNELSANYVDVTLQNATAQRLRPTLWAATAMLSRAYLYTSNWAGADSAATAVINNSSLYRLTGLDSVFLTNSPEAIWQLQPVNPYQNTQEAPALIPTVFNNQISTQVYLSNQLLNSFEPGDQRRQDWVDSVIAGGSVYYYAYKYKAVDTSSSSILPVTEYTDILRLGEQYLIRAEARVKEGNIAGAQADLNMIRNRAGLPNTTASDESSLLKAIAHERQVELFLEWGDRWLDLKRTGALDSVMSVASPLKGGSWNTDWGWYPLPLSDIQIDPNLKQNTGY